MGSLHPIRRGRQQRRRELHTGQSEFDFEQKKPALPPADLYWHVEGPPKTRISLNELIEKHQLNRVLRAGTLQERPYQLQAMQIILEEKEGVLIHAPTNAGKTFTVLPPLASYILRGARVFYVTITSKLVTQAYHDAEMLYDFNSFTGSDFQTHVKKLNGLPTSKRLAAYSDPKNFFFFVTAGAMANDLENGRVKISDKDCFVLDEGHCILQGDLQDLKNHLARIRKWFLRCECKARTVILTATPGDDHRRVDILQELGQTPRLVSMRNPDKPHLPFDVTRVDLSTAPRLTHSKSCLEGPRKESYFPSWRPWPAPRMQQVGTPSFAKALEL